MRYLAIISLLLCTLTAHTSDDDQNHRADGDDAPYNHFMTGEREFVASCEKCLTDACKKIFGCFSKNEPSLKKDQ